MISKYDGDINADLIHIIKDGFTVEGLQKLDYYAELHQTGRLLFNRFSPREQYGCAAGGSSHVIASMLAGAKIETDTNNEELSDFQRELQFAAQQIDRIEKWSKKIRP